MFSYCLLDHSGGAQGSAQEPQGLWISWVSLGSVAPPHCSGAASSGSPENLTINSVFALEKLHRSPTLLPRVSTTGFLLIPILFHPETTREKLVMGPFVFKSFHNHSLGMSACPADGGLCDSPMLTGELPHFLIFRKITPKGRQSVYADHPEKNTPPFNNLTSIPATQKMLLHYKIRARGPTEQTFLVKNLIISVCKMLHNKVITMAFLEGQLGNTFIKA